MALKIEYFDTEYGELIDSLDDIAFPKPEEDLIIARIQNSLRQGERERERQETVITSERLTLRYCACKICLGSLVKRIIRSNSNGKEETKVKGICPNLDHVYLRWLSSGRERVLFMNCPHAEHLQKNCYYIKGKARIYLGSYIRDNINDYNDVRIMMRLSDRTKTKLINRHYKDLLY